MPSLWSWLPNRKYTSEIPLDSSESNKKRRRRSGPIKKLFSFGSKDDHMTKSRDTSADLRRHTSLHDEQSVFPHMAPKTRGIERALEEERNDDLKKLEDLLEGNNNLPRRPLAYEIFEDPNKPRKKFADESTFLSQPSLSQSYSPYEPAHNSKDIFPRYHAQQERNDFHNVEMRKKSPNIFAGLVSRGQRNSMLGDYPVQGRIQRMGAEPRRSESMYGYVPRAVSLHDASAVLSGQEKEEKLSPKHQRRRMDHFAQRPDWNTRISEELSEMDPDSVPLIQNTPSRRQRSVSHDVDMRGTEFGYGLATRNGMGHELNAPAQRNRQLDQMKQATGNNNFYFSSSFLSPTRSSSHADNSDFVVASGKTSSQGKGHIKERKQSSNKDSHSNNNNNNSRLNNNNSNVFANTNNSFWLTKADIIGSDHHVDQTHTGSRQHSKHKENADNESDVTSLLEHFDQLSGIDNAVRNDKQQLEGIFSTVGEVLY